ncbi:hydantoinase/oxoprolinase family protein [uncultured Pseudoteredinibacter sp.]|uniref:hydantoinase/oxoprolinase family protein n=1 Tax=uncultured Pseudoteredinibacter sp. TaxID=1641701 RepID=UPI00261540F4|nr:hydantoinase/oxoprolinase family protein [uncultured Pseudoteredinibacter sp.]
MKLRVATDVGGTFTDLVYISEGEIHAVKSDTVYPNFDQGVINAAAKAKLNLADVSFFAHGTTVVINALTERKGVKTALITTSGFRDVLEIARGNTPDIFNNYYRKPEPFVPRYLRRELSERVDYQGQVLQPPRLEQLDDIVGDFQQEGVEAIALCFLHAYLNPQHEQLAANYLRDKWPTVKVICSHEICSEWREYERSSTTVLSAYVLPPAQNYLDTLKTQLSAKGLASDPFIMQSNGGIATLQAAKNNPISLVESGPVGGMLGAVAYGQLINEANIMALDIGGTTAKCSLVHNGRTRITTEYIIEKTASTAGYPIKTPVIDIVEIGNGGGSIAHLDAAGSLRVGPESAGSTPGPVAYGRGGKQATTTDANLFTGKINPENFAGGEIKPDMQGVEAAFQALAEPLGVKAIDVAHGVIRIANANMVNALKLISVNRGYDPRDFALMAFGGGGAMHACALARELNARKLIIPPMAGVFSAFGMLMIDLRRDYIRTQRLELKVDALDDIQQAFAQQINKAESDYQNDGFSTDKLFHELFIDARYQGQEHTVKVKVDSLNQEPKESIASISAQFHKAHEQEYSFQLPDSDIEIVNFHLVSYAVLDKANLKGQNKVGADASAALIEDRAVDYDDLGVHQAFVYQREKLCHGMSFEGPAIIEESTTTTVVEPGARVEVDGFGGLHIYLEGRA